MAPFYYSPGVQDRRGELLAAGISTAGTALADAITQAKQKHDENKAYGQLATVLGLDPKHTTKQQVQAAILKNEIMQAQQQRQQQQAGRAAIGNVLRRLLVGSTTQMTPEGTARALIPGAATSSTPVAGNPIIGNELAGVTARPQSSVNPAARSLAEGLEENPETLNTPEGQTILGETLKSLLTPPKVPIWGQDKAGRGLWFEPSGTVKYPPVQRPAPSTTPEDWTPPTRIIGGKQFYQEKPGGIWKPFPQGEQREGGDQPQVSADGKFYRSGPLDGWKPMPRAEGMDDFLRLFGGFGGTDATTNKPSAPGAAAAIPTVDSQDDYDALESGAQYYDSLGNLRQKK